MSDEKQGIWASLPLTSKLPTKKMKLATSLLQELQALKIQSQTLDERWEEIEQSLEAIQLESNLSCLRFGNLCFRVTPNKPGKSFKQDKCRELLIERAGVEPELIKQCFDEATEPTKVKQAYKREFKEIEV